MHSAYRFVDTAASSQVLFEMPWNFAFILCNGAVAQNCVIKSQGAKDRLSGFKSQLYRWLQDKAELLGRKGTETWVLSLGLLSLGSASGKVTVDPCGFWKVQFANYWSTSPLCFYSHTTKAWLGLTAWVFSWPIYYLIQCIMNFPGAKWESELSWVPVIIHLCIPPHLHWTVPVLQALGVGITHCHQELGHQAGGRAGERLTPFPIQSLGRVWQGIKKRTG